MYNALQVAHYIIDLCYKNNRPVSNLELQKILYFLQVCFMRNNYGKYLIIDDFCAWKYGPVIPSVYRVYSGYGGGLIRNSYNCSDIDPQIAYYIRPLILRLESVGPWQLVDLAHKEGGPWHQIYKSGKGEGDIIPKCLIATDNTQV